MTSPPVTGTAGPGSEASPTRRPAVAVVGVGATGTHAVRHLAGVAEVQVVDTDRERLGVVSTLHGVPATDERAPGSEIIVLTTPGRRHLRQVMGFLQTGRHVVSVSDDPDVVDALLDLDDQAISNGVSLVVGAGFAPGLTCLLARFAADEFDEVDEIAVWKSGTAGPACARQHHRALKQWGLEWVDGAWVERRGGSGRDLAWFPGEIGAHDSYRAALPSPRLLHRSFPDAHRLSARVTATRRDRLTSRLPMLRRPHADGGPGAVRVEVRGHRDGRVETLVYGVDAHPSVAAGTMAAIVALGIDEGIIPIGSHGLSEVDDPRPLLRRLRSAEIDISRFGGT